MSTVRIIRLFLFLYRISAKFLGMIVYMTYKDLIDRVAESQEIPKTKAKDLIASIFDILGDELASEKGVSIPGLGTFKTKTREERRVYSPHHETYILVPPKRVVDFTPSSNLKENLKFEEAGDE